MLGTGIASADEDVNPDKPASPLDGSVTAPVHINNNAVGTPLGQKSVPALDKDASVRTSDVTGALPVGSALPVATPVVANARQTAAGYAEPVLDKVSGVAPSLTGDARDQAAPLSDRTTAVTGYLGQFPGGDKFSNLPSLTDKANVPAIDARNSQVLSGNSIDVDVVIPVDLSGNAIAVLGKAEATNDSSQSYGNTHDVHANGAGGVLSGNVADVDWALPIQVVNNAIAVGGTATADGTSSSEGWATGDIVANGSHSLLGGNVVAPQFATPVQVDGNGIAVVGFADASSEADNSAESGGSILTSGQDSIGGGNSAPVPVAMPLKANGNAIMAGGRSTAEADSSADATAGATRTGMYGVPTYVETNGDPAVGAGNVAQPSVAGPVALCGNAGGAVGAADATCDTASEATAGGTTRSTGAGSILSGSEVPVPVGLPVSGYGNAPVAVGNATTDASNTVDATSGGDAYTRGHDSIASGTAGGPSVGAPVDVFNNAVAGAGDASSTTENTIDTTSGGNTGSTGDNSVAGGNMVTAPVATAGEAFGNTGAAAGSVDATATEHKTVSSGGQTNAKDDNGLGASNVVNAPVATAAQAFGNGAGAVAFTDAKAKAVNEVTAGGPSKATGTAGTGSGNIVQAPVSEPFQFFGNGASAVAKGEQVAVNSLDSKSGGDATSDGSHAVGGGNVVSAPAGGAGQVYGETVAALGKNDALAGSVTHSDAGGDTVTSGESGVGAGNVVSPQAMPVVQSFAAAASGVGGVNSTQATNKTHSSSGGDIDTNGDSGFLSGNLADVPAAAVVQPFGDAVSAVGSESFASGYGNTHGVAGGTSTTSGNGLGSLSGLDATVPVGANAPVYDVPVEVLAQAMTQSANTSDLEVGEGESQLNLPVHGGIQPTELPTFTYMSSRSGLPHDPVQGTFSGVLNGFASGLTGVPGREHVTRVAALASQGAPVATPAVPQVRPAPARAGVGSPIGNPVGGLMNNPATGLVGGVFGGGGNPVVGVLGNTPVGGLLGGGLPVQGLPVQGLPVNGLPVGGQRDLPQTPQTTDFGDMLSPLSAIQPTKFGGFGRSNTGSPLEYRPAFGDLTDVTTIIPALPAGDPSAVTAVLPVVPAVPVQAKLPVVQQVAPRSGESTLDSTRAALANLFNTHPIG